MSFDIDAKELLVGVGPRFQELDPHKLAEFLNGMHHRLEALEEHSRVAKQLAAHITDPERERQDRWHATRDAVLTGCYAKPSGIGPYGLEYWMREATSAADRAHGPLEATLCQHENYSCAKERQDVAALVKAALGVVNEWGESDGLDPRWPDNKVKIALAIHALSAAAKPFEGK